MTDEIIPAANRLAAKRAFVRTTAQAYAATLTTGISASVVLGVVTGTVEVVPILVTLGVALVSPLIAGAAAYAQNIGGIPQEYTDSALVQQSVVDPVEAVADQNAAVARVQLRRDLKG